ncbi:hypothetical protein GWI33_017907 [Rhynchophorus ferrugineus]|uniref:Uncharacterized protein n=1 Tax=Rhynchophorus ferrugineus TaxID=354439 RepID=A0A834HUI8_RHYFE|nr:hypothetical protein GWI33_017907 [Rhynchophorus ferrugineus]
MLERERKEEREKTDQTSSLLDALVRASSSGIFHLGNAPVFITVRRTKSRSNLSTESGTPKFVFRVRAGEVQLPSARLTSDIINMPSPNRIKRRQRIFPREIFVEFHLYRPLPSEIVINQI